MRLVTASKMGLLFDCPAAFSGRMAWTYDPPGPPARMGSLLGKHAENWLLDDGDPDPGSYSLRPFELAKVARAWAHLRAWLEEQLRVHGEVKSDWLPEVAGYYHPATGRFATLGRLENARDYGRVPDGGIPGTPDFIVPGRNVSLDLKFTRYVPSFDEDSYGHQMRTNAMIASNGGGMSMMLIHASEAGITEVGPETFDAFDAVVYADRVKQKLAVVDTATPVAGPHCDARYCGARQACEAYMTRKQEKKE